MSNKARAKHYGKLAADKRALKQTGGPPPKDDQPRFFVKKRKW